MRGKEYGKDRVYLSRRITPAYAGKRLLECIIAQFARDHPRLCGEKDEKITLEGMTSGSPPPMRGKDKILIFSFSSVRITPAYAGKRTTTTVGIGIKRDHPRLCGEKLHKRYFFHTCKGSPPPMRGKVQKRVNQLIP